MSGATVVQDRDAAHGFRVKRTADVHVHAAHLAGWKQEYEQLSSGTFVGEVRELVCGPVQVFAEVATRATAQYCRAWDDGLWVGWSPSPASVSGVVPRLMGRPVHSRECMVSGGQSPFVLQVPDGVALHGIVVRCDALLACLAADELACGCPAERERLTRPAAMPPLVVNPEPLKWMRLTALVRSVLEELHRRPYSTAHPASRAALQETVVASVAEILQPNRFEAAAGGRRQRRKALVRQARDIILATPHFPVSIEDICTQLHVTRRTLHNGFLDVLGVSPAAYLRVVRLNGVRRCLCDRNEHRPIAEIAAQWGFWHMGHFGHEYKQLFGETPSQTRAAHLAQRCVQSRA